MTSWRFEATVLTDLSASVFAVCFLILLMFIAVAKPPPASPAPGPIDAETRFRLTPRQPPGAAEMVEALYRHGRETDGTILDLFADRVEIRSPDRSAAGSAPGGQIAALIGRPRGDIRLYVFSNALYAETVETFQASGIRWTEISVPRGLRDNAQPSRAWSPAFHQLETKADDSAVFRQGLARLLDGGADDAAASETDADLGRSSTDRADAQTMPTVSRWRDWLAGVLRRIGLILPLIGIAVAVIIRLRSPPLGDLSYDHRGEMLNETSRFLPTST